MDHAINPFTLSEQAEVVQTLGVPNQMDEILSHKHLGITIQVLLPTSLKNNIIGSTSEMPSASFPISSLFSIRPLSAELRKDTLISAEVVLNSNSGPLNPDTLTPEDISALWQALYDNSVLVIRKSKISIHPPWRNWQLSRTG
jgi:hypothetical protein